MICPENKNVARMRFNKVITKLVDKYLVARVDRASCNDVPAMKNAAWENVEIMRFDRRSKNASASMTIFATLK